MCTWVYDKNIKKKIRVVMIFLISSLILKCFYLTIEKCPEDSKGASDTPELGMDNVGGVFLVLGCGLGIAILIGILEFLWNVSKVSAEEKVSTVLFIQFSINIAIT